MRWAAPFYRQAARTARPKACRTLARLRVETLEAREVPTVSGTVFIDANLDGFQDPEDTGVAGVTVTATDAAGATETTTTAADGTYTLPTAVENLRVVFSALPGGLLPGRAAGSSGPLVRFLDAEADRTGVDLALASPQLVTTQFFFDHALEGINTFEGAVLSVPYGADSSAIPNVLATVADVGSVWGLAYQPRSNSLYASSFVKRHAGLGPNAAGTGTTTGGIYKIDPTGTETPTLLIDLNTAGAGLGAGADPHPTLPDPDGNWFNDAASIGTVGKRGLGGLAISEDGRTLYTVNLATRELVEIPLKVDGTRDTGRAIRHTSIPLTNPAGSGITSFSASDLRPFAVTVRNGAVFVGVTYTAETSGGANSLRAFVYAFNPAQGEFRSYNQTTGVFSTSGAPAPVLIANLTYARGMADDPTPDEPNSGDEVSANWRPWVNSFPTNSGQEGFPVRPSPWLTDIAFDGSAMVLGIRDRFGDQGGFQTGASSGDENEFSVIAVGDILRAAPTGSGGWQLESNGSAGGVTTGGAGNGQGPGGGEFYFEDNSAEPVPQEVATGGLAQVPGFSTIAATGNDVESAFSGGIYTFNNSSAGGTDARVAGMVRTRGMIYESFDLSTFGSANGLGDLAAIPADGTVQAGDRVFEDINGNGVQDAGEPGIADLTVRLFQGSTEVDSVVTGAGGDYLFDGLTPHTAYEIRIDTTQPELAGRPAAAANQGADDLLDSDATESGSTAIVAFTTGDAGTSFHGLDFGFSAATPTTPTLTLGNQVFRDANNNGTFDTGEIGVAGVTVELLDATGAAVLGTTTTNASGVYTFTGLTAGTYRVRLAAANFSGTGPLIGFVSSTSSAADPNNNVDNDNNGVANGPLGSTGVIQSGPITLAVGTEPTDGNTNLTLDFGVVPPAPPPATLTLGDTVFRDANNNGTQDAGEAGIAGVTVELMDSAGTNVLATTLTNVVGKYSFAGLAAGTYRVRLPNSNFAGSGVLVGMTPSTAVSTNPDDNVDGDNNGSPAGTSEAFRFITSGPITLALDAEPTDGNSNLTLDFGMVPPPVTLTLGNLVWNDANGNGLFDTLETGINGVAVQLLDAQGAVLQTTTTASGGIYTFTGLAAGDYKVRLAAANFSAGGPLAGFANSNAGSTTDPDDNVNNNNDGKLVGTVGAGGYIESGFITLAAGAEPISDGDANPNTNLTVDFGLKANTMPPASNASLTGRVFRDFNSNGSFNGPDTGITGVTLTLAGGGLASPRTTTTDAQGNYSFAGLPAGIYTLTQTQPTTLSGKVTAGSAGGTAVAASNTVSNIALGANTSATGYLFAEVPLVSTGGAVYEDLNGNGTKDAGEPGIPNVTVTLTGTSVVNGTISPVTVTTDSQGNYTFANLTPGTYAITEAQPAGYADGNEQNGTPAGTVSNDRFAGIDLTQSAAASGGFNFGETRGASLAGAVYDDVNNDGVRAATGEAGIAGVKVRLVGTDDLGRAVDETAMTGADGAFEFGRVRPGTYRVIGTHPTGYAAGKVTAGSAGGTAGSDRVTEIVLTPGTAAAGYLFGQQARADLRLTQSPGLRAATPGGRVTVTYTLKNLGTAAATATAVDLKYGGLTFESASVPAEFDATARKWTVGSLAAGETRTIQVTYRVPSAGTFAPSAKATTTATELPGNNNGSASTITVGVVSAPTPMPTPSYGTGLRSRFWFLSSAMNAIRIRRL